MRVINIRMLAVVLIMSLAFSSFLTSVVEPPIATNDESDLEHYFPPSNPRLINPTRAGTDWPMFLNNPTHTSFTTDIGPITDEVRWYSQAGGVTYSSPIIANGMIYIGSENGSTNYGFMSAYYVTNGTLAWRFETIETVKANVGISSTPAVDSGYIVFGGDRIYCLYANNGTLKWTVWTEYNSFGDGSPTIANGKVFIGGSNLRLYCIDLETGNVIWRTAVFDGGSDNCGIYSAPAVLNGHVYFTAGNGTVNKLDEMGQPSPPADAIINHSYDTGRPIYSSPVIAEGRVFFGNGYIGPHSQNRLYCLNAENLSLIWSFYPGSDTDILSSPSYYNGTIYVGSTEYDRYLYALNASSDIPEEFWRYDIGGTWSTPALTKDRLYIGSQDNRLYVFNLSQPLTPNYYWRSVDLGDDVVSSPVVYDGSVYVGTHGNGGRLYCFGSKIEPVTEYINLEEGWNLISTPLIQIESNLGTVLDSINGSYDAVQIYDTNDDNDPWKHHQINKPSNLNDLKEIEHKKGFWIHVTEPGGVLFQCSGILPIENQSISLKPGWNLVGYPSLNNKTRTEALNNLTFGIELDAIWTYNASSQRWKQIGEFDYFERGRGYYIHTKSECTWEVPL